MLGLGVAFSAVPFLGLFLPDLVHQVQPLSLLLNGITALFAVFGFARSGLVDWQKAITLSLVTTAVAPTGAYLVQFVPPDLRLADLSRLCPLPVLPALPACHGTAGRGKLPTRPHPCRAHFRSCGFLGIGPGFLLMPTLILVGFNAKMAAGINAFAVCPPSFSSLIPHIGTAQWDIDLALHPAGRRRRRVLPRGKAHEPLRPERAPETDLRRPHRRHDGLQDIHPVRLNSPHDKWKADSYLLKKHNFLPAVAEAMGLVQ